ncbi:MAG: XRE family transcriptional regulator [Candidatus Accumulibacter sp.]|nr:XRE family transcriptional regulator [Accumulibacter sp.]
MSARQKAVKAPKMYLKTGKDAVVLRKKLGQNQTKFWGRIATTQSGGSRYEGGRRLPGTVQFLLHLAYAPDAQAQAMLEYLRTRD